MATYTCPKCYFLSFLVRSLCLKKKKSNLLNRILKINLVEFQGSKLSRTNRKYFEN